MSSPMRKKQSTSTKISSGSRLVLTQGFIALALPLRLLDCLSQSTGYMSTAMVTGLWYLDFEAVRQVALDGIEALVFGGALSPVLVAAGRKNGFLSYGVFGVTISMCALFVGLLPETRGRVLCDTLEEEERKDAAVNVNGVRCV